eukprot:3602301-Pyramimonas_sp.AAC.1
MPPPLVVFFCPICGDSSPLEMTDENDPLLSRRNSSPSLACSTSPVAGLLDLEPTEHGPTERSRVYGQASREDRFSRLTREPVSLEPRPRGACGVDVLSEDAASNCAALGGAPCSCRYESSTNSAYRTCNTQPSPSPTSQPS